MIFQSLHHYKLTVLITEQFNKYSSWLSFSGSAAALKKEDSSVTAPLGLGPDQYESESSLNVTQSSENSWIK